MKDEIQFILYNLPDEDGKVQVIIRDETLWCTQKAMAQLFGVDRTVVSKHLKNIFESSELQQDSVCAKFAHTAEDGKIYNTQFYNLDAVISVGYRVQSPNQKIPDRKTKCVIKTHINIKQNVIFGAKLKPV